MKTYMTRETPLKIPLRYKIRISLIACFLTLNTWALASLAPPQKLSLSHKTLETDTLSLRFYQQQTSAKHQETAPEKPVPEKTALPQLTKQKTQRTEKMKTLGDSSKTKLTAPKELVTETKNRQKPTSEMLVTEPTAISPQPKKEQVNLSTNLPAQSLPRANPIISEPTFSEPPLQPRYPSLARKRGQQGTVWLEVWLDEDGEQIKREISESSGVNALDKAALKAVSKWQFLPYQHENRTIASRVKIPVQFVLN